MFRAYQSAYPVARLVVPFIKLVGTTEGRVAFAEPIPPHLYLFNGRGNQAQPPPACPVFFFLLLIASSSKGGFQCLADRPPWVTALMRRIGTGANALIAVAYSIDSLCLCKTLHRSSAIWFNESHGDVS